MSKPRRPRHSHVPWARMRLGALRSSRAFLGLSALSTLLALSACGGGNDTAPSDAPQAVRTTAVKVVGDSLSDGGTFGAKATIQAADLLQTHLWVDLVTRDLGLAPLCPRYVAPAATGLPVLNAALPFCTNHAVGGGVIHVPGTGLVGPLPFSIAFAIETQLRDLNRLAPFEAEDVVLADGGGNDAALLFSRYLEAREGSSTAWLALLNEQLTASAWQRAVLGGPTAWPQAGHEAMMALADRWVGLLQSLALEQGARRVVVLTVPNVARTPRLRALASAAALTLARQQGLSAADEAAWAASQSIAMVGLAGQWVAAFNARVQTRLADDPRVAFVDFYALLNVWIDDPSAHGFGNAQDPACPITSVDARGIASYDIATCTQAALDANPPPGKTAGWWSTHVFADHFHGTPRVNQRLADEALRVMRARGWR